MRTVQDSVWADGQAGATIDAPDDLETPCLVVDRTRLERNLSEMYKFSREQGIELYPHFKTHRTREIADLQSQYSDGFCIAKLGEAERLTEWGFTNFVMAYPLVGQSKIDRAKSILRTGASLLLSADSLSAARALSASMAADGLTADLLIIVDTGFHREGIGPDEVLGFARALRDEPGVRLRGLLTHEGHANAFTADEGDHSMAQDAGLMMARLADELRSDGIAVDVVSVGSTGTARLIGQVGGITQLRPGIYPFNDYGQLIRGTATLQTCAARVFATVVSHAAPDRALIDAGSKTLGQDMLSIWWGDGGSGGHGLLVDLPGWELHAVSEEHGWLRWAGEGGPGPLDVGRRIQILPNHICSVFHVLGESIIVDDGVVIGRWISAARGESR